MTEKILALSILLLVYVLMLSRKVHRTTAVLLGSILAVGAGILDEHEVLDAVQWEAFGLIFGMFVIVTALKKSGFFRWIGLHALRWSCFRPTRIFIAFSVLSAFLAAFMDSITVLVFMASLTVEVCSILKLHPGPLLTAEITSANIGGASTMVGDPPNVILGTSLGFSFPDFVANTGTIAVVAFCVNLGVLAYVLRRRPGMKTQVDLEALQREHSEVEPSSAITDFRLLRVSLVIFVFTVTLLVLHHLLDILVAFVAILGATLTLALGGKDMPEIVEKIDWHTLLFLAGLFIVVGGLDKSGVLADIASGMAAVGGGNLAVLLTTVLWVSATLSMFLDNVPFAAAMVPVLRALAADGAGPLAPMTWSAVMGADIGGNATPIGASANVVGPAVAEKHSTHMGWLEYMRIALPAMILSVLAANVVLLVLYR